MGVSVAVTGVAGAAQNRCRIVAAAPSASAGVLRRSRSRQSPSRVARFQFVHDFVVARRSVNDRGVSALAYTAPSPPATQEDGHIVCAAEDPNPENLQAYQLVPENWERAALSFCVVGASGDLAKKKIYPSLFALFVEGHLPKHLAIFGYARSPMNDESFREMIGKHLKSPGAEAKKKEFLQRCFYHAGQYDSLDDFKSLDARMCAVEKAHARADRVFYLSVPPNVFTSVASSASEAASSRRGWTRVIVEKPFGRDLASSQALGASLRRHLEEDQIYRIDHYLGKELIENLTVLRFANLVFEPLWSRQFIKSVQVIFTEDYGTEGRGGYFDQYGIIRDVVQNHLLQILALFAMEQPVSLSAEDIRDEKVKVLRSMRQVSLDDVVLGQYRGRVGDDRRGGDEHAPSTTGASRSLPGYLDDPTVPAGSLTPTFAACAVFLDSARWQGVPFLLKAGKALESRVAEIRVQFRQVPGSLYRERLGLDPDRSANELVIRIQPDEAIHLKINNKVPGLGLRVDSTRLDLTYKARYIAQALPDAYERLILDAVNGDRRLFIRDDELEVAWQKFTPLLQEIEHRRVQPEQYPYGSRGPVGAHYLAAKYGVRWGDVDADNM